MHQGVCGDTGRGALDEYGLARQSERFGLTVASGPLVGGLQCYPLAVRAFQEQSS